jgi:DNA-binding response OmpR family regulator
MQGKKRILVAEDDPAICDVLRLLLEDAGYAVETTADGAIVRTFPDGYPDLLLIDIWLPGANGGEICRFLKGQEATRTIPILLISANRDTEAIATETGADGFILKPFDLDAVLATIARHL